MKLSLVALSILFSVSASFAQMDSIKPEKSKEKFEFESESGRRTFKIKKGRYLNLHMYDPKSDTSLTIEGTLVDLNDSIITIDASNEYFHVDTPGYRSSTTFDYHPTKMMYIPNRTIKYIYYNKKASGIGPTIAGVSAFTLFFLAPLISLDKSKPYYFNPGRYTTIAVASLIGVGTGFAVSICIGFDRRVKPKAAY